MGPGGFVLFVAPRVFCATQSGCGAGLLGAHRCSGRRRARPPARLGDLTAFGAAPRSPPVPSGPSGALHTGGAWCAVVWTGALSRSPARPRRRPRVPQPGPPVPPAPSTPVGPGVLTCGLARRLEARPGPAAAHGYRRLALSTRWVGCLKPSSPLLAGICVGVKPASPLRARNGLICCIFRVQW